MQEEISWCVHVDEQWEWGGGAQEGFSGKKKDLSVCVSLSQKRKKKETQQPSNRPLLLTPPALRSAPTVFSLLADRKIQRGAGIWGAVAQGKWVSRLRDGGQLSVQFPRLCPLSELPTDTVACVFQFCRIPFPS